MISSATLHEAAGRTGALPAAIKPLDPTMRVYGSAVTVHGPGGDNLWLHRAIYQARPGDVLVVTVSQAYEFGYWGELMATAAVARGLGGLVLDGCVRDADALCELGFPVFARGLAIRGTAKDAGGRGGIDERILLGDVLVAPGDLIVGDRDGVVAVPRERADEAVAAGHARDLREAVILTRLRAGERTLDVYDL